MGWKLLHLSSNNNTEKPNILQPAALPQFPCVLRMGHAVASQQHPCPEPLPHATLRDLQGKKKSPTPSSSVPKFARKADKQKGYLLNRMAFRANIPEEPITKKGWQHRPCSPCTLNQEEQKRKEKKKNPEKSHTETHSNSLKPDSQPTTGSQPSQWGETGTPLPALRLCPPSLDKAG